MAASTSRTAATMAEAATGDITSASAKNRAAARNAMAIAASTKATMP